MFVHYTPEGQETQRFEFKPGRVRLDEAARIEFQYSKLVGGNRTYQQFVDDVKSGSAVARRVLLFTCLRRQHPQVRFEDVNPFEDELETLFSRAELEEMRAAIEKASMPEKEQILARLDLEIAEAPDAEEPGKADGGTPSEPEQ